MYSRLVYINGIKASKKALSLLNEHILQKRVMVQFAFTKSGNLNIKTFDL